MAATWIQSYIGLLCFLFPKDLKRRKIWIQRLNRGRNFIPKSHSKICFKHFDDNQFLISPKLAEAVGYRDFRLGLKSDAVPTVFDFKKSKEWRTERQKHSKTRLPKKRSK